MQTNTLRNHTTPVPRTSAAPKNTFLLLLAILMLVFLGACKKSSDEQNTSTTDQPSGQEQAVNKDDPKAKNMDTKGSTTAGNQAAEPTKLTGKLNIINLEDRDPSILRGVRIIGKRIGSQDDINGKASSLDDVRNIFELNEWIEFYPDTDAKYALRVWILKHRDDQEYYNKTKFSDMMPGFATYCDLHYPVDNEDPANWYWGSFYLNPEEHQAGYYDFVFTYEGKAIAVLLTRFYNDDGEISGKSGAELEALMHE